MIHHANQLLTQALVLLTQEASKLDSFLIRMLSIETLVAHRAKEALGLLLLKSVNISYTHERFQ